MGSKLFVFGGEDVVRRPLGELLVLDLATWRWSRPETSGAPITVVSAQRVLFPRALHLTGLLVS